jgi:hypothetical protein
VIPELFLRDMYKYISAWPTPPMTTHYSPMLHNALLALGSPFSDNSGLRDTSSKQAFVNKAKSHFETERKTPGVSLLKALSILGIYHWSQGEYDFASRSFGECYFTLSQPGLLIEPSAQV